MCFYFKKQVTNSLVNRLFKKSPKVLIEILAHDVKGVIEKMLTMFWLSSARQKKWRQETKKGDRAMCSDLEKEENVMIWHL